MASSDSIYSHNPQDSDDVDPLLIIQPLNHLRLQATHPLRDCAYCQTPLAPFLCSACLSNNYCNSKCQRKHWKQQHYHDCQEDESTDNEEARCDLPLTGIRRVQDCAYCNKYDARFLCARCYDVKYCDRFCQVKHWNKEHRHTCFEAPKPALRSIHDTGLTWLGNKTCSHKQCNEKAIFVDTEFPNCYYCSETHRDLHYAHDARKACRQAQALADERRLPPALVYYRPEAVDMEEVD